MPKIKNLYRQFDGLLRKMSNMFLFLSFLFKQIFDKDRYFFSNGNFFSFFSIILQKKLLFYATNALYLYRMMQKSIRQSCNFF
jgi:hypothetical protein